MSDYWYDHRDELSPGNICLLDDGSVVKLDRRVPVSEPLQRAINETREKIRECFRPIGKRIPATLRYPLGPGDEYDWFNREPRW